MQLFYSFDRIKKGLESEVIHTYVSQRKHVSGLKHMVNRKAAVSSPTFLYVAKVQHGRSYILCVISVNISEYNQWEY